jgi:signal transduction histidine kinase
VAEIEELRAARARLAEAAGAERRRIERALHDGVQQDLIAVSVRLQLARQLAPLDLPAALELLDELRGDVRDALERVRTLAGEIYPSLLDARGLGDALREAARRLGTTARVETTAIRRYPAEIEIAAYTCCRYALEQIAAQAGAEGAATIRLQEQDEALRLEVAGGGNVFEADDGFVSVRDLIEAARGDLSIGPTCIAATIPLV